MEYLFCAKPFKCYILLFVFGFFCLACNIRFIVENTLRNAHSMITFNNYLEMYLSTDDALLKGFN